MPVSLYMSMGHFLSLLKN